MRAGARGTIDRAYALGAAGSGVGSMQVTFWEALRMCNTEKIFIFGAVPTLNLLKLLGHVERGFWP